VQLNEALWLCGDDRGTIVWMVITPSERVAAARAKAAGARASSARAHDDAAGVEDAAAALYDRMGDKARATIHRASAERHRAAAAADRVPLDHGSRTNRLWGRVWTAASRRRITRQCGAVNREARQSPSAAPAPSHPGQTGQRS